MSYKVFTKQEILNIVGERLSFARQLEGYEDQASKDWLEHVNQAAVTITDAFVVGQTLVCVAVFD
jgi:hypothetical protein